MFDTYLGRHVNEQKDTLIMSNRIYLLGNYNSFCYECISQMPKPSNVELKRH